MLYIQQEAVPISKCRWHQAMSLLHPLAHSFAFLGKKMMILFIYKGNLNFTVAPSSIYLFH